MFCSTGTDAYGPRCSHGTPYNMNFVQRTGASTEHCIGFRNANDCLNRVMGDGIYGIGDGIYG